MSDSLCALSLLIASAVALIGARVATYLGYERVSFALLAVAGVGGCIFSVLVFAPKLFLPGKPICEAAPALCVLDSIASVFWIVASLTLVVLILWRLRR